MLSICTNCYILCRYCSFVLYCIVLFPPRDITNLVCYDNVDYTLYYYGRRFVSSIVHIGNCYGNVYLLYYCMMVDKLIYI